MATQQDKLVKALRAAEEVISGTLSARGYKPGSCTDEWSPEVRAEVAGLAEVRAVLGRLDEPEFHDDCDEDDGSYRYGCGEFDTVDSKGRRLRNGGRTCNDAGEPYWM